ncbi:hypothetical protein GN244_ATG05296 [Phytophthora infestans]|uniref:Ubiquitin-like domain-containing protein n=1 Tax=Phytophthora infestans TaxID=4787 RepID=A0A833SYX6_PHYIN|nr:hypothetical protein GN244_ATG05296 [Phytophthora infestans]KAF4144108.1 hypothetical protein GN958_ATG06700 [Phytophthora infestans]KAI9983668.1 hypothetical protein PInf_007734 [Phytophthora infestans]
MPPKKKTKGKKNKASAGGADAADNAVEATSIIDSAPPIFIQADPVHYVTLDMRLLNWSYLNFKFRTKTSTRLFAVKQQIQKQHGPITELKICKGHFAEANELRHDMMTLAEYGVEGAPEGDPEVVCLIHYDFKPEQHDNPLLLAMEKN